MNFLHSELRTLLEEKRLTYLQDSKQDHSAVTKLKEIDVFIRHSNGLNPSYAQKRSELMSKLPVTHIIDESVVIGTNAKHIFTLIENPVIITDHFVFDKLKPLFPPSGTIAFIEDFTKESLISFLSEIKRTSSTLIGIGGGKVMDYLKYIQYKTDQFCIAIPSSLTTHVYTSPKIVVTPLLRALGETKTIEGPIPDLSFIDSALLEQVYKETPKLILTGFGDIMACITALYDWKLALKEKNEPLNYAGIELVEYIIDKLITISVDKPLLHWLPEYILIQTLLCRITGWLGSAPASGSEHLFAIALEDNLPNPPSHGELVALGTLIMAHLQGQQIEPLHSLIEKFHLSHSLSKLNLSLEKAQWGLEKSQHIGLEKKRFTIVNTLSLNKETSREIIHHLIQERIILN